MDYFIHTIITPYTLLSPGDLLLPQEEL